VRHSAIPPLGIEEMLDLAEGPVRVVMREADGDERGVPAPLMRVKARGRLGPSANVVAREDTEGRLAKLACAPGLGGSAQ
jgi:hypothetical protein